jgi:hypothetical protein
MSTATPAPAPAPAPAKPKAEQPLVPPDEQFWVRYSPHHEFPLSTVTSFALHVLAFGVLLLFAMVLIANKPVNQVPVEAVRLAAAGGGGGNIHGVGDGPGHATAPVEEGGDKPDKDPTPPDVRPDPIKSPGVKPPQLDDDALRAIKEATGAKHSAAFSNLMNNVHSKLGPPQTPGAGKGGSGSGGGQGDGVGKGTGDGRGDGVTKGSLTQREKRMLRWTMRFNTNTGRDYVAQLAGLGAILAVPVGGTNDNPEYELIRDLTERPAKMVKEDVYALNRIFWYDNDPRSTRDVMGALGIPLVPSHFVAFIPQEVEDQLYKLERAHAGTRPEDDIKHTYFRVKRQGNRFVPELEDIQFFR